MNANENKINAIGKILKFNTSCESEVQGGSGGSCVSCGSGVQGDLCGSNRTSISSFNPLSNPCDSITSSNSKPLGTYGEIQIISKLGEGSSGEVFLGRVIQSRPRNTEVAVKILRPTLIGTPMEERFSRESLLLCSLSHPSIVKGIANGCTQFESGAVDIPKVNAHNETACLGNKPHPQIQRSSKSYNLPFLIMENLQGNLLSTLIYKGELSMKKAIEITIDIAGALEHIRLDGRVLSHRDIKPANIMILPDGSPKLMDLGVARTMIKVKSALETQIAGTLHYMAPEQIAASSVADIRSDIFSLGLVLFEMLGGKLANDEREMLAMRMSGTALCLDSISIFNKASFDKPVLGAKRGGLKCEGLSNESIRGLRAVLLKMCAFEPDDRYQTPRQVAFDLARILDGVSVDETHVDVAPVVGTHVNVAHLDGTSVKASPTNAPCRQSQSGAEVNAKADTKGIEFDRVSSNFHRKTETRSSSGKKKSKFIAAIVLAITLITALLMTAVFRPTNSSQNNSELPAVTSPSESEHYAPPKGTEIVVPAGE